MKPARRVSPGQHLADTHLEPAPLLDNQNYGGRKMLYFTQILTIVLAGIAMAPALGHAFEFPGKKRLNQETYVQVQAIYYPGYTLLGASEPAALIAGFVLLWLTPVGTLS